MYARRNLHYRSEVGGSECAGTGLMKVKRPKAPPSAIRHVNCNCVTVFNGIRTAATDRANAEITNLLSSRLISESPLLFAGAIREMEVVAGENNNTLTRAQILTVAERFNNPEIGEGLRALTETTPELVSNQVQLPRDNPIRAST